MSKIDEYVKIVPSKRQYELQKMGFYAFLHFGINTFANKEWSDGTESPAIFNPTSLDTDQWCAAVKSAGMKAVILTAKHHDGFCLWQTDITEYSIKNSPYKDGKGDIVRELKESCDKYGLKMGVYLSPWDRNAECYGTDAYNDYYIAQLTELLTRYGDIFELWLDGACGSHLDGKPMQVYDFPRIYAKVRELQPGCIIANCGPDCRWIGNEGGLTRDSEWNVVPKVQADVDKIMDASQSDENIVPDIDCISEDLGSRAVLEQYNDYMWYPAEVDVSIRPGWFYHASEDTKVRSVDNLLNIYYSSVGGNAMLLLNIPPDTRGLIHEKDVAVLAELGERIRSGLATKIAMRGVRGSQEKRDYPISNILKGGVYSPELSDKYVMEFTFKEVSKIDKVVIREDVTHSQRIEEFAIYIQYRGRMKRVYKGTTVGMCKVALFKKWTYADGMILMINECRNEPFIEEVSVYEADGKLPPQHPVIRRIKKKVSEYKNKQYAKYVARVNAKTAKKTAKAEASNKADK